MSARSHTRGKAATFTVTAKTAGNGKRYAIYLRCFVPIHCDQHLTSLCIYRNSSILLCVQVWYAPMGPTDPFIIGTQIAEGDLLEVRAMADQGASNEDVGINSLKMTLRKEQTYPYDAGNGWVYFDETSSTYSSIGIAPAVGGKCPGALALDNGCVLWLPLVVGRIFFLIGINPFWFINVSIRRPKGAPICTRNMDSAGNVAATFNALHDTTTLTIDIT